MKKFIDYIVTIIIILLAILIIYWFIELISGGSPTLNEFNFAFIILMLGFLFKIYREIGEIKIGTKQGFSKLKGDFKLIKKDLNSIKTK